ncbi:hypothetical protein Daus18300_005521 [Diaporthe australafricana]|uniref:Uncharacterized protein n=1 Tax=Diaporthe australafricana TaxID=127596 RepID=A0ABR3X1U0_9PEZI
MGRTRWVSFIPHKDVLLFGARHFRSVHREISGQWSPAQKAFLKEAEHIVVQDSSIAKRYLEGDFERISKRKLHKMLRGLCEWTLHVGSHAFFSARNQRYGISSPADDPARPVDELAISANDPVINLRIVDIAMNGVTEIDNTYPPGFIQRLFGSDLIRIVDLRCEWEYRAVQQMIREEFPANIEVAETLAYSMRILDDVEDELFVPAKYQVLIEIARYRHSLSVMDLPPQGSPPSKDNELDFDGELDFEADWARELIARLDIRPVHVFKRVGGA